MYVFGIDMPLPELLFIAFIILFITVGFILWEIVRLRRVLTAETTDLGRFEKDINVFEQDEHRIGSAPVPNYNSYKSGFPQKPSSSSKSSMLNRKLQLKSFEEKRGDKLEKLSEHAATDPKLNDYVDACLKKGVGREIIRKKLIETGWPMGAVDEAIRAA